MSQEHQEQGGPSCRHEWPTTGGLEDRGAAQGRHPWCWVHPHRIDYSTTKKSCHSGCTEEFIQHAAESNMVPRSSEFICIGGAKQAALDRNINPQPRNHKPTIVTVRASSKNPDLVCQTVKQPIFSFCEILREHARTITTIMGNSSKTPKPTCFGDVAYS